MIPKTFLGAVVLATAALAQNKNNDNKGNANNANNNNAADGTTLLANAIQTGSFSDGQEALGAESGEAASQTSQNNFINFCAGQTLTNGLQLVDGSCNGIPMGQIPNKNTMISSIILNPPNNGQITAGQDFNITVQVDNLQAGAFTNAEATYYSGPQFLNKAGQIVGHTHVTVQDLGSSQNPSKPPDPTQFAFFKGINDAGNGKGLLTAVVAGGLPEGFFRVCTLTSAQNHQPVLMPVAQRGSQDDCNKFQVVGAGGKTNEAASNGAKGQAAQALAQSAADAASTSAAAAKATAAASSKDANANAKNSTASADSSKDSNANANSGKDNANSGKNNNASASSNANKDSANKDGANKDGANKDSANKDSANKDSANAKSGQSQDSKQGQQQDKQGQKAQRLARFAMRSFVA